MEDAGPSTGGRAVDSGSGSGSWRKYLDLSEGNSESSTGNNQPTFDQPVRTQPQAASPSTSSKWSGSWIDGWLNPENASSAPGQPEGEVNQPIQPQPPGHQPTYHQTFDQPIQPQPPGHQPTYHQTFDQPVQTQPPAAGPSEPSPAPVESSPSLSLSNPAEFLRQFFSEEGATVEQQEQPGAPEAMPQAPAEDTGHLIKTSIIQRMGELYPMDPWDPENPLIREKLFPGGKGKTKIRPMTVEELNHIHDRIIRDGKKAYWAKELHRRINSWSWNWKNPCGPS